MPPPLRDGGGAMSRCFSSSSFYLFLFLFFLSLSLFFPCKGHNSLSMGHFLRDGETLVSLRGKFELGFFSPANSTLRCVGIWYHNITVESIVWVANRDNPLSDKNGVLTVRSNGSIVILDGSNRTIWSSSNYSSSSQSTNSTATLMDTGNLILIPTEDNDTDSYLWQSFDHPTDTFLPSMRVKVNQAMGENWAFTSWKSGSNPSLGNYTMGVDPRGSPQIVVWEGSIRRWRTGHWNGLIFMGIPNMNANYLHGFQLSSMESNGNMYFTYTPSNSSDLLRFRIRWDGQEEQLRWNSTQDHWEVLQRQPANRCEVYNHCGDFGICNMENSPVCSCMKGFTPKHSVEWKNGNWFGGCMRRTELQCGKNTSTSSLEEGGGDGFLQIDGVKLPDFADLDSAKSADDCKASCLGNCSCYAFSYVVNVGCMVWSEDLIDVQHFESGGWSLFVRVTASELDGSEIFTVTIVLVVVIGGFLFSASLWLLWRFKDNVKEYSISCCRRRKNELPQIDISTSATELSLDSSGQHDLVRDLKQVGTPGLPLFNFSAVAIATDDFSEHNKLGKGGFGPVYKGKLPGGQEIAVKRLSRKSCQGLEEFKNELALIAKLQHKNLVRLLGYCVKGEEKMLIYEYMPNKSLDCFLFDQSKKHLLDWRKRLQIIEGIARGLLYLHRDSRLRIIHRDMKASNILLDEEMNPKISDFGMARIIGGNQYEANTTRVVGTFGYIPPEYAMEGMFSVKSDVYSFGVLLLEIISGSRNTEFQSLEHSNLIGHAWHLWNKGEVLELVDPAIANSCVRNEVDRCIHVGMLCVQDSAAQRPTMSSIILLLESEATTLPDPRKPTFTSNRSGIDSDHYFEGKDVKQSLNDVTVTRVVGR